MIGLRTISESRVQRLLTTRQQAGLAQLDHPILRRFNWSRFQARCVLRDTKKLKSSADLSQTEKGRSSSTGFSALLRSISQ